MNLIILACRGFCSLNLLLSCQFEFVMLWFIFNNICKWAFGFINKTFAQNALFNIQWRSWSLTFDAIAEVSSSCLIWQWNAPFLCKSMKNGGNILAFWQKVQNIFFLSNVGLGGGGRRRRWLQNVLSERWHKGRRHLWLAQVYWDHWRCGNGSPDSPHHTLDGTGGGGGRGYNSLTDHNDSSKAKFKQCPYFSCS